MMPITDAHHHIWRRADLPWLAGPMQPRIFGPYEPIRRDYPIAEYLDDVRDSGVHRSVYVQANWPVDRATDEVAWVSEAAAGSGWPHAIVGYADFTVDDVGPQLAALAAWPLMRGVRQQFHWHADPMYRFAPHPDLCADPAVRRNLPRLADRGWVFELQVFTAQMTGAAALARACPAVTFVLQHAGMPEDRSPGGIAAWRTGMARLAEERNVVAKLSGLGTFIHRNDPAHIAAVVAETVGWFGADRCLFGSNFPIEKLWTGYASLVDAYRDALAPLPADDRRAIFDGNAGRVYRLADAAPKPAAPKPAR